MLLHYGKRVLDFVYEKSTKHRNVTHSWCISEATLTPPLTKCEYNYIFNSKAAQSCLISAATSFTMQGINVVLNSDNTTLLKCR